MSESICTNALRAGAAACLLLIAFAPSASRAEVGWVRDTVLSVRETPGGGERIGVARSGDRVTILERGSDGHRIRLEDGTEGWISKGFLRPEPPPVVSFTKHEEEVKSLETRLEETTRERDELSEKNAELSGRDSEQRGEIERLTRDNMELRAGARWPEWITGASVLVAGMILGIVIRWSAARRPQPRIRL